MFTGLIEKISKIRDRSLISLTIDNVFEEGSIKTGDSLAVNGVCLTVSSFSEKSLIFEVSPETFSRTNLKLIPLESFVNLERALKLGERLGGHFVSGHVDASARLKSVSRQGDFRLMRFTCHQSPFLVEKGSVAVNGVSLTCYSISSGSFLVSVIGHTLKSTNLQYLNAGDNVNIEFDILAKYALGGKKNHINTEFLKENGFL
ncbi:MAG: riboflavin synthase [Elusimicrobiota bacterium]